MYATFKTVEDEEEEEVIWLFHLIDGTRRQDLLGWGLRGYRGRLINRR